MNIKEILNIVAELGIKLEWHSYRAVPNLHRFAVWNIPNKSFYGADGMAFFVRCPLQITFFYRESKSDADFTLEAKFESAVREMGEYSCTSDYDSANNLFYTQYTFNIDEEIEDETEEI